MIFYRTFQPFKLLSFDLDDTIYDNAPVIQAAEAQFLSDLQQRSGLPITAEEWQSWKQRIAAQFPAMEEDVTRWRRQSLEALLGFYGKSAVEILKISQDCMATFLHWRHKISVPAENLALLRRLAARYPLVAISNGNVDPQLIGLNDFSLILRGGEHGRAKPHPDLFWQTARQFNLQPQDILHIGDNLQTDVGGAINAGCQAAWLNLSGQSLRNFPDARHLPTLEIRAFGELACLAQ